MNINAIKSKVSSIITQYGTNINIYRDIYEKDECECEEKVQSMVYIDTIKGVIDNSSGSYNDKNNNRQGIVKLNSKAFLYIPFEENPIVKTDDYLEIDGIYYRVGANIDIVHYNILYKIPIERIELNE